MRNKDKFTQTVRKHYERWPFPGTEFLSRESLLFLKYLGEWLRGQGPRRAQVVDVGCGTGNTTIALAKRFPDVSFLGVDISRNSLAAARRQAREQEIRNVCFERADLSQDFSHLGRFRGVISTGVLHHLANLPEGFRRVAQLVEPGGYLLLWLYGRHGRARHHLNQHFLRLLTKGETGACAFSAAQAFLRELGGAFATGSGFYTPKGSGPEGLAWLLQHPQWLADQMIPPLEQSVTIREIINLFSESGLHPEKWFGVALDLERYTDSSILRRLFRKLSWEDQWTAIDYLLKPEYYFVAGRRLQSKDRKK
jgi:2-polyprenyl-3-methyl-5-hydroxy-6-metoxy-1,4-benzoquinol methylase